MRNLFKKWTQRMCFGVGHFFNDLCASMWFSYLLVYFHKVLEFNNKMAGNLMMVGQIADGLATPFVGYESDRRGNLCNYGRRKTWHLVGTVCVALSFPMIFMRCIGCTSSTPEYAQLIYYLPMIVIFQFGWAATQINHLALIPELARNNEEKITLNALRYGFTILASIFVYGVTWILLSDANDTQTQLGPTDLIDFRNVALIVTGTGLLFSIIFHVGVRENDIEQRFNDKRNEAGRHADDETTQLIQDNPSTNSADAPMMEWSDWFKKPMFYQMALLYMSTRLVVNLSQVYMPMYLTDTLNLPKQYIANVPLVMYISGFVGAVIAKIISKKLKTEVVYFIGSTLVLGSCIWAHYIDSNDDQIFGMAATLGCGSSMILVMCLAMVSAMIGNNTETGAFVYGAMSLTDKISNGIAILVIQYLNPCPCHCPKCGLYFEGIMTYIIGSIMVIAIIALIMYSVARKRERPINTHASLCGADFITEKPPPVEANTTSIVNA